MQRVEEQVLSEVALGQRAQGAAAQQREARGAHVPAPRRDERACQPLRVAPAVARGELRDVAVVVAQLLPELLARDVQQAVEARLVVGEPVVVDPRLGRQPVRRGVGRRERVVGLGRGRGRQQREDDDGGEGEPARGVASTCPRRGGSSHTLAHVELMELAPSGAGPRRIRRGGPEQRPTASMTGRATSAASPTPPPTRCCSSIGSSPMTAGRRSTRSCASTASACTSRRCSGTAAAARRSWRATTRRRRARGRRCQTLREGPLERQLADERGGVARDQ